MNENLISVKREKERKLYFCNTSNKHSGASIIFQAVEWPLIRGRLLIRGGAFMIASIYN